MWTTLLIQYAQDKSYRKIGEKEKQTHPETPMFSSQFLQSTWQGPSVHTPGRHRGSKENRHPPKKEKQINNTNNWICPSSVPGVSGKRPHALLACCDRRWQTSCSHFGLWAIPCGILSCFSSHLGMVWFCVTNRKVVEGMSPPHSYFIFPFTISPSNILCGLPTLFFFPQTIFDYHGDI